ncbi:Zinc finger-containing ubiquitin peptidase 1 [Pseudocercospora fuligena]|uniref:Zinc finger-containing ubiquitin peptidase 1 n=1 Tax=Pseudocercospora fuligena TaxID=685502 RepID=A0A8H6R6K8_9PEZI|nr:Zinc finger-containing ubiquitin peptidase 1 [Pseudocercospora fuligena]
MSGAGNEFQRLGKRDLGRYAFESRMPERVAKLLANENASNSISGVIPNLALLLENEPNTELAYLCTNAAVQVSKLANEGAHFCGYRNIQMLLLALAGVDATSSSDGNMKSSIPEIQQMIENAWEDGHNAHGKVLTGGIQGTRKHIGTSEAEAILLSLSIPCRGRAYTGPDAWKELLDAVETYFTSSRIRTRPPGSRVIQTDLSPVFLQRPQHSLMIVGFERTKTGTSKTYQHPIIVWRRLVLLYADSSSDMEDSAEPKGMVREQLAYDRLNPERTETILFIHGAFGSALDWDLVVPHLKEHHLLLPDLPGHGRSHKLKPFSLDYAADLLADLIRSKADNKKAHVVGHSLGASVAIRLARRHSDVVRLVLVSGITKLPRSWFTPYLPRATCSDLTCLARQIFGDSLSSDADQWPLSWPAKTLIVAATKGGIVPSNDNVEVAKKMAEIAAELNPGTLAIEHPLMRHPWPRQDPALFAELVEAWLGDKPFPKGFKLL